MISKEEYYQNFNETYVLIEKLKHPYFLKTELDVVYDDFVRWEMNDLLWIDFDEKTSNKQRKYSYLEYTWVNIVEQLRSYGFDYGRIKRYRKNLKAIMDNDIFWKSTDPKKEDIIDLIDEESFNEFIKEKDNINIDELLNTSLLEMLLLNCIVYNDLVSILFFQDKPEICLPISGEVYKAMANDSDDSEYKSYITMTHLSISLNDIIKKYIIDDLKITDRLEKFKSILSEEEHSLLKIVRKKFKNIKSIKIRFHNDEINIVEIESAKKVTLESKLLEHIKKGDYSSIHIEAVNGKIVDFKNTQKIKI